MNKVFTSRLYWYIYIEVILVHLHRGYTGTSTSRLYWCIYIEVILDSGHWYIYIEVILVNKVFTSRLYWTVDTGTSTSRLYW